MKLYHHVEKHEDFFLPYQDGLSLKPVEALVKHEKDMGFSDVETILPATEVQKDILKEDVQWAEAVLFTGKTSALSSKKVLDVWRSLAYHYICLRSCITDEPTPKVVVQRCIEPVQWHRPEKGFEKRHRGSAFLTVEANNRSDEINLVLHFHRALIDTTSLHTLRLDCLLQIHGIPGIESTGFTAYTRYLAQQRKDIDSSKSFWSKTLSDIAPQSIFGLEPDALDGFNQDRHGVSAVIQGAELATLNSLEKSREDSKSWRQTFLEAVWAHVLSAHSDSEEVLFGTVRRDASFVGADTCVGCLDQTYPIRLRVPTGEDASFSELSNSLDEYHTEAGRHAFIGYTGIEEQAPNDMLIETAVSYSQTTNTPCIAPSLRKFPVVLCINDASVLQLAIKCTTKIPLEKVELVFRHFISAIFSAAKGLSAVDKFPLSDIQLVSEAERRLILSRSVSTRKVQATTIPALFEKTVARNPERVAVDFQGDTSLTFAQLNSFSNQLARRLRLHKDAVYPILADRSLDLVVAILAVLKAGSAYTVLDSEFSVSRLEQVVSDCNAAAVLSSRRYMNMLPNTVNIEQDYSRLPTDATESLDNSNGIGVLVKPQDRCYIIYTSGSTGKPKGAVLTHEAATSGMQHHSLNGLNRWLLFYNPSFSAAQRTILSTLVNGGTLVLAPKEALTQDLAGVINRLSVDALGITPSALSLLSPKDVPNLKSITLVGEQTPQELVNTWSSVKGLTLRNTYGLSECTQLNFGRPLTAVDGQVPNPRILDPPIDTTSVFILRHGSTELSPLLVFGELCLAGPQLAKGYINEPGLTEKAFIANPFGPGKLYRTGDKARWLPNGQIEIEGRVDMQVKINGQKVEPAEVDRLLVSLDVINGAVTFSVKMEDRQVLATGVVLDDGSSFRDAVKVARNHLRANLPVFMTPTLWIPIESVPRNGNGKLNYHLLRTKAKELGFAGFAKLMELGDEENMDENLNDVEEKIASVWAESLKIDRSVIRRSHSFTDLGGTSIEAIRVVSELREHGLATELGDLLAYTSLSNIASRSQTVSVEEEQDPAPFSLLQDEKLLSDLKEREDITDAYPVTPFQESMLVSVNSPSDPYTYSRTWDVSQLDLARLRDSFDLVFKSRDILRTVFVPYKQSFVQTVRSNVDLPWFQSQQTLEAFQQSDSIHHWDMEKPLWKATLTSDQALVVTMHHSLFDFWSHGFLYDDVAAVYTGNQVPQRPSLSRFIRHLQQEPSANSTSFWAEYLQGAEVLKLNSNQLYKTSKLEFDLGYSLTARARSVGLTLGAVIYSAWAIVLSRQMGSNDITFATTVSGREAPVVGINDLDGPTMSTVPQRIKLDTESTLRDVAQKTVVSFSQLLKHSQVGIAAALKAGGIGAQDIDTLVNILIDDNKTERPRKSHEVFKMRGSRPQWESGHGMTVLEVQESSGQSDSTILRLSSNVDPQRLGFIKDSLVELLRIFCEKPDSILSSTNIMGAAEYDLVFKQLSNRATLRVPEPEFLYSAFKRISQETPDAIAIDFNNEETISYGVLDKLANRFAHKLIEVGVQPGDLVPIMLDKSVDMMVVILGTMIAGAAYVPLSPDNPTDRNSYIVSDTSAKLIVVHPAYVEFGDHVKKSLGVETLVMKGYQDLSPKSSRGEDADSCPVVNHTPDNLAYLIYTSGSTGLPKGVKVPHRTAAAAVTSMIQVEGRNQGVWRTLQFANYVFDASVQDFFNTLSSGGTLCMAQTDVLLSDIAGCINRMGVRQAIITPTVAKLLNPADVPRFETLIVGGEPLTSDVIKTWAPHCKILNVYGPTETSMVVTTKRIESLSENHVVGNIGAPFYTVMAFILDPNGETLQPYGAVGELCIAGPQVTDGYVNRPELTAATYVDSAQLGVRIYRTGDLARWLPDGEIECLGRKDNQVKIHGHRIELGEVENVIRNSGLVKDAIAVAAKVHDKIHLVAFCTFDADTTAGTNGTGILDPSTMRDTFGAMHENLGSLATYMVPKFVIPMTDFPKLPSRKVDRKALKKMLEDLDRDFLAQCVLESTSQSHAIVPVETLSEIALESVWANIFGLTTDQIGREANFLALGGDSISAISLTGHLRKLGYHLTVLDILQSPKLKDMASAMRKLDIEAVGKKMVFNVPENVKKAVESTRLTWHDHVEYAYLCPPGQAEFLKQGARDSQMWVLQTVRRMNGVIEPEAWIKATTQLTEANDILRTTWLEASPGNWVGVVLRDAQLNIKTVAVDSEDEMSDFLEDFWRTRFEFGRPFIKYAIITHGDSSWDLVIKMDHAVYDGTLLRVFDQHFENILQGKPLPPRIEFRDFTQHVFEQDKAKALEYWKEKFTHAGQSSQVLKGQDLGAVIEPRITASFKLKMDTRGIDQMARNYGVTPSIIFQAAFTLWLARATQSNHVRYDYLLSGRNVALPDPQSINGTLANFLPIWTGTNSTEKVSDLLTRLQEDFWAVTENGLVGLDDIYQKLDVSREAHGNKVLFLSQPFDPVPLDDATTRNRWLVMAKSKVRMYQPYALVVEVSKSFGDASILKVMYDEKVFDHGMAEAFASEITGLVSTMMQDEKKSITVEEV
ncbi:non-ribosomal peptide synthetase [Fusarium mangiferae]|uniref:Non-ribosomal peptide synthetase n=1 Tax=Fusarium mangiferae TaxID=192010 RepID=A0A1L7U649_FUSMA|nr:non-ribosomal peptide synthetase [Fusarium mangiferae]CVL02586.1 non-ribosomal peptide synthetase [Fusarium mangiferae]